MKLSHSAVLAASLAIGCLCTTSPAYAQEATVTFSDVNVKVEKMPDADHAFMNPTGTGYHAPTAAAAWERTVQFIDERLVRGVG